MTLQLNAFRSLGMVLILAGGLALAYGGFTYTKDTDKVELGPVQLSVKEKETVNVPVWAGVAALVGGALLMLVRK